MLGEELIVSAPPLDPRPDAPHPGTEHPDTPHPDTETRDAGVDDERLDHERVDPPRPAAPTSAAKIAVEPRILAAWRQWLSALATDAEAALAAAHVYGELAPEGRDSWLDALDEDGPKLGIPRVALYAPLLSVEVDRARLARIQQAIALDVASPASLPAVQTTRALRGIAPDRTRIATLVAPLYMDFVQVLSCRYSPHTGFVWVKHDPLRSAGHAPKSGYKVDEVVLETTPLNIVVEDLALAILAQRRRGDVIPPTMALFANLFDARFESDAGA
jgi:hypothetical protein